EHHLPTMIKGTRERRAACGRLLAPCKQGNSQEDGGLGTNSPHSLARYVPLAKTGGSGSPGRGDGVGRELTIREIIGQAFLATPQQVRNDICRWAKCRDADVDVDGDVWIADPQSGHWLGGDDLARLSCFMGI